MSLSEKRKELFDEQIKDESLTEDWANWFLKEIEKQDKKFIQEAQKDLKEEFPKEINGRLHNKIDEIFKNKFGDLAK